MPLKINFINLNNADVCSMYINRKAYNILFLIKDSLEDKSYESCFQRFINKETLLVSNFVYKSTPKPSIEFVVNRDEDKYQLINE